MACFLVPTTEAIIVTVVKKSMEKKAKKEGRELPNLDKKFSFVHKLGWLSQMLWGGSFLLAIEHAWHGEIIPYAPFLTAMGTQSDKAAMFHEMSTVGVTMAVLVTAVWGMMLAVSASADKKAAQEKPQV